LPAKALCQPPQEWLAHRVRQQAGSCFWVWRGCSVVCHCSCFPRKKPELLFPSIANIRTNAVQFALANPDDGFIDFPDKDLPAMSINMTILLTLIVSFSIALAGVVHI
jgi:hypothetical protein